MASLPLTDGERWKRDMLDKYLGDSYDLVKRYWADSLRDIAPLFAHPRFVPAELRARYSKLTTIKTLEPGTERPLGILLDPDTGIPLPSDPMSAASASHAPLPFIIGVQEELHPEYMICFDQSVHRSPTLRKDEQRRLKMAWLMDHGLASFYYVSHAPFLFMAPQISMLQSIRDRLITLGIPESRFELSVACGRQRTVDQ